MAKNILVVAAHPDDEILGCGGTIARLAQEGHKVFTLILGEGVTSRLEKISKAKTASRLGQLRKNAVEANKIVGARKLFVEKLPDNRFDSVDLLEIVKIVEKYKQVIKPEIIFTHYAHDMNIDHCITNKAVLTAARPMLGETVKEIYAFEVLSSTEWNFPLSFSPNYFVSIRDTLGTKIKAMGAYKEELREYPHPRSLKAIELNAKYWGVRLGVPAAEAFMALRTIV